jgi:hypothetical protein
MLFPVKVNRIFFRYDAKGALAAAADFSNGTHIQVTFFSERKLFLATDWIKCSFVTQTLSFNWLQKVTKICRLSWLTNSTLVYEPQCGGGMWLQGLSQ